MPVCCMRKEPGTDRKVPGFLNTHHVLMQAYAHAIQRDNENENTRRQVTQTELTRAFVAQFTSANADPEKLYTAAGTFTRSYLHSFMPDRLIPDARFAPYDEIATSTYEKNPVVQAACEHLAGMIFYDECPVGNETVADAVEQRPYKEVLDSLKCLPFSTILSIYAAVHRGRMQDALPTLTELAQEKPTLTELAHADNHGTQS
ncbi:hypothetical protein T484DRAFT_1753836 [Baffinella frigidus]|nr:hypothetical protein T484DRAFT_1753836 [Cryptophyta sp. CCMP2293]